MAKKEVTKKKSVVKKQKTEKKSKPVKTKKATVETQDIVPDLPVSKYPEEEYKWFIVASSSGRESKTAELIKQKAKANNYDDRITEAIVPTQEKIVIKRGKKQTVEERIFPGYILVKLIPTDDTFQLIRTTEGVSGFVGTTAKSKNPTALNPKEVEGILAFTKVKQAATFESKYNIGEAVKVVEGPFENFVGTVQEINEGKGQVTVLLNVFGQDTPVQLDLLQVSKITS